MKPVHESERFLVEEQKKPSRLPGKRPERRLVERAGYAIRADNQIVDVKVDDLSYDGCAIRTSVPLEPGEIVKLTVLGHRAVMAVVRWYEGRKAGLLFQVDRRSRPRQPRRADRNSIRAEATLRRSARTAFRVTTFDVTRFGCKCEFVDRPSIQEKVWINFDGLHSLEATVCWVEESNLGLMFHYPMHPAVFDMLLSRLKPESTLSA
jgi:hypothetical protein